jgi:hypothetical protein
MKSSVKHKVKAKLLSKIEDLRLSAMMKKSDMNDLVSREEIIKILNK